MKRETSRSRPKKRRDAKNRTAAAARPELLVPLVAALSIALPLLFYVNQHVEMLRHGYEIEALKARRAELAERHRLLSAARSGRTDLKRIEAEAAERGLVAPGPLDVFAVVEHPDEHSERSTGKTTTRWARLN